MSAAGVAKDCTEIEIKKAYRKESLKHHPDKVSTSQVLMLETFRLTIAHDRVATKRNSS